MIGLWQQSCNKEVSGITLCFITKRLFGRLVKIGGIELAHGNFMKNHNRNIGCLRVSGKRMMVLTPEIYLLYLLRTLSTGFI